MTLSSISRKADQAPLSGTTRGVLFDTGELFGALPMSQGPIEVLDRVCEQLRQEGEGAYLGDGGAAAPLRAALRWAGLAWEIDVIPFPEGVDPDTDRIVASLFDKPSADPATNLSRRRELQRAVARAVAAMSERCVAEYVR